MHQHVCSPGTIPIGFRLVPSDEIWHVKMPGTYSCEIRWGWWAGQPCAELRWYEPGDYGSGNCRARSARIHIWSGDELQTEIWWWINQRTDGCINKIHKLIDDWCIAAAEQSIFLSSFKQCSDRNRTWPCQRLETRLTRAHMEEHHWTSEGQFLTLAKLEGPVTHKHLRWPQGPRVPSGLKQPDCILHLLNI